MINEVKMWMRMMDATSQSSSGYSSQCLFMYPSHESVRIFKKQKKKKKYAKIKMEKKKSFLTFNGIMKSF